LALGSSHCTTEGALIPVYICTELCQADFQLWRNAFQEFINTVTPCAQSCDICNRKPTVKDPRKIHGNLPALLQ